MVKPILSLLAVSGLGLFLTGASSTPQTDADRGIPGYLNPRTLTFQARPTPHVVPDTVTLKDYTGTLKFEYTITVHTTVPSGQELLCEASTIVVDEGGTGLEYMESASSPAKVSGTSGTCTVEIPYSWPLESPSDVSISYSLLIAPTSATSQFNEYPTRSHSSDTDIAMPAVGATTTILLKATV
jgi:hypothetical protein